MSEYLPIQTDANTLTMSADAAVIGGRLVEVTGPRRMRTAGTGSTKVVGVAGQDAGVGDEITVHRGGVQSLLVGATAVMAGDHVTPTSNGGVITGSANTLGLALTSAGPGEQVAVLWQPASASA